MPLPILAALAALAALARRRQPRRLTIADSPPPRPVATAGRLSGVGSFMRPATA